MLRCEVIVGRQVATDRHGMEIVDFLKLTGDKYRDNLLRMHADLEPFLRAMPAAVRWHHAEKGGLYRHTLEVIKLSVFIFDKLGRHLKRHGVVQSDVIMVGFIHDLEKTSKYKLNKGYDPDKRYNKGYNETQFNIDYGKTSMNDTAEVVCICARYGIILSDMHINAITYHHGGWSVDAQYAKLHPLASILHSADLISATLFKNSNGNMVVTTNV